MCRRRGEGFWEHFWRHIEIPEDPTACWLFKGRSVTPKGYAQVAVGTKHIYVHRLMLEMKLGRSISKGLEALHSCTGVPNCVNPDHLREGTHAENMKDVILQDRLPRGDNHHSRLTSIDVANIRYLDAFLLGKEIAVLYGLQKSTVSYLVRGINWKENGNSQPVGRSTSVKNRISSSGGYSGKNSRASCSKAA